MLYKTKNEAIKFFNNYSSMVSKAKNRAKNETSGKGLKILTPKQINASKIIDSSCTSKSR